MSKAIFILLSLVLVLPLVACATPANAQVVMSDKPRETSPVVSETEQYMLAEGNSAFAFDHQIQAVTV